MEVMLPEQVHTYGAKAAVEENWLRLEVFASLAFSKAA